MKKQFFTIIGLLFMLMSVSAQDINLPHPQKTGGIPLMEALQKRSSHREFSSEELDKQTLSNLLWAAWGFNRTDKRTAPSGNNKQDIDVYIVMQSGAYLYDAKANKLIQVVKEDIRKSTGKQSFVWDAPVNLVFVADKTKGDGVMTSAFASQNVSLFCASEGLATVMRGYFDAAELGKALKLKETQSPVLTQTVGKKK